VRLEVLGQLTNPITLSGIEYPTFQLVVCCLNQLRYFLSTVSRHTRLQIYKINRGPVLTYDSDSQTVNITDKTRLTTAVKHFANNAAGYNLGTLK
jgi:hypothetical protein